MVILKSHEAMGSFLGKGTHVWIEVHLENGEKVTFSGANVSRRLRLAENLKKDFDKPATRGSVVIPPPSGLSESEWARRVIEAAREVKRDLPESILYSGMFPKFPGFGNCCTVALEIVQRAGGAMPRFKPAGFAPGLS